jgi:hypothetical protein
MLMTRHISIHNAFMCICQMKMKWGKILGFFIIVELTQTTSLYVTCIKKHFYSFFSFLVIFLFFPPRWIRHESGFVLSLREEKLPLWSFKQFFPSSRSCLKKSWLFVQRLSSTICCLRKHLFPSDLNVKPTFHLTNDRINLSLSLSVLISVIHSLRDVRVKVPSAVRRSDTVVLHCYYDMEGDSLYSVKWYKG